MRKDFPTALAILAGAFLLVGGCWYAGDIGEVWIYDVKPWLHWDGKPSPEPVGGDLKVQTRAVHFDAE